MRNNVKSIPVKFMHTFAKILFVSLYLEKVIGQPEFVKN